MRLAELIAHLEIYPQDQIAAQGFSHPHSYRGYYDQLAFEPAPNIKIADMLRAARQADGSTYTGWKGGDYTMDGDTQVWIAVEGECSVEDEPLTVAGLAEMIGGAAGIDRSRLARSIAIELYRSGVLSSIDAATEDAVRAGVDAALGDSSRESS